MSLLEGRPPCRPKNQWDATEGIPPISSRQIFRARDWRWCRSGREYRSTLGRENATGERHVLDLIKRTFAAKIDIFRIERLRAPIETLHFIEMKWPRPAPAEDHGLAAGLIDDAIALEPARDTDRLAFRVIGRDQFRIWPWTKSLRARDCVRRNQLHHAQSILPISNERELRCTHTSDLDRARVVHRATRVEHLIETRRFWIFNIDNRQTLRAVRDIGVSARDIEPTGMVQSNNCIPHRHRMIG